MTVTQATAAVTNLENQLTSMIEDLEQLKKSNCVVLLETQSKHCAVIGQELTELRDNITNNKTQMAEQLVERSASLASLQNL